MNVTAEHIIKTALAEGFHLFVEEGRLGFKQTTDGSLSEDLKQLIIANKSSVVDFLSEHASASVDRRNIVPKIDRSKQQVPLSFAQQRLWLLSKIDGGSVHYNMPAALTLNGTLDLDALQRAFTSIVERHESLRTCFVMGDDGQAVPLLQSSTDFEISMHDLSMLDVAERECAQEALVNQEANQEFNLEHGFMLKVRLLKIAQQRYVLLVTMHHIASDGWSMGVLINEFNALYTAYRSGKPNPLSKIDVQYGDFAHWQRNWLQGEILDQQLGYWAAQLKDLPVVHSLPLDRPRPLVQSFIGETYFSHINYDQYAALNQYCQQNGATLFMGLHTLFSVLLSRLSNETDIVIGTAVANREQSEIAGLIGFFVNSLVLRSDLSNNPNYAQMLAQSKSLLLDAYAHQQVPFEQVVDKMQPERTLGHSPMFQIMLVLQNTEEGTLNIPGISLEPVAREATIAKYDLTFNITQSDTGLTIGWEYNVDLFDSQSIAQMAQSFNYLLNQMVNDPEASVMTTPIVTPTSQQIQVAEWNNNQSEVPTQCLQQLFEHFAATQADAPAILFDESGSESPISYAELNTRANYLAHYLLEQCQLQPDTLVGVYIGRSHAMVVAILAILKAGAAYVPMDPEHPTTRLNYIVEDGGIDVILTTNEVLKGSSIAPERLLSIDDTSFLKKLQLYDKNNIPPESLGLKPENLAYVVYTSGSTGRPKGVMVTHANITPLIRNSNYFDFGSDNVIAQASNMSFDAMTFELWGALLNGGKLVYISKNSLLNPVQLKQLITDLQINTLFITTALFNLIAQDQPDAFAQLDTLLFGGEDCSKQAVELILTHGAPKRLLHMYGPTENTTYSLYKSLSIDDVTSVQKVALGKCLSNNTAYVLDSRAQVVPIGVVGELYLGGSGVARGYLNRDDLTASAFIDNPYSGETGQSARLYKTGDLVRYLPNGDLEFVGRIDHQVKIRGFRIELGEIEHALVEMTEIKEAFVIAQQNNEAKSLVAYIVPTDDIVTESHDCHQLVEKIRQQMQQNLPDYMVPGVFMLVAALPLTSNGKVDRKSLPQPSITQQQSPYIAPSSATEKTLTYIWERILSAKKVGIEDNFFDLGGNSLSMVQMISAAKKDGLTIEVGDVWKYQTVASMAAVLDQRTETKENPHDGDSRVVRGSEQPCYSTDFILPFEFNETLIRLAINKLLTDPQLQYDVKGSGGNETPKKWVITRVKRNRKALKALWSIGDDKHSDFTPSLSQQKQLLCNQIRSFERPPIGLRWLNNGAHQHCLLVAHPALMERRAWQYLVQEFNDYLLTLYTQES